MLNKKNRSENTKQFLYIGLLTIQLLFLLTAKAMNKSDNQEQKEEYKQEHTKTPENNHILFMPKKQALREQAFGQAIVNQDIPLITYWLNNGIQINDHFTCFVHWANRKKPFRYKPLVFALIHAKDNFAAIQTLLDHGAHIKYVESEHFVTNSAKIKQNIEKTKQLFFKQKI